MFLAAKPLIANPLLQIWEECIFDPVEESAQELFVRHERYRGNLEEKDWEGWLVGYFTDSKACKRFNPDTCRIVKSRTVTFIETLPSKLSVSRRNGVDQFDDNDVREPENEDIEGLKMFHELHENSEDEGGLDSTKSPTR